MGFKESLQQGELGELIVKNYLEKLPKIRSVVDLRFDKHSQLEDVDFFVEDTHRQFFKVEVKTDFMAHKTGNIAYELSTSNHTGCFDKTKADYIAYYLPESKELYMIKAIALRNYVYERRGNTVPMGDNAEGVLIPIKELQANKIITAHYTEVG